LFFFTDENSVAVSEHNSYRTKYGVPALTGNIELAEKAEACINYLFENRGGSKNWKENNPCKHAEDNQGENFYASWSYSAYNSDSARNGLLQAAVQKW